MQVKPIVLIIALSCVLMEPSVAGNYNLPPEVNLPSSNTDTTTPTILPPPSKPKLKPTFKLELSSHSDTYRIGDSISFYIKSNKHCYLTVLNISTTGKITVFYPNALRPNSYITKNTQLSLPSEALMPIEAIEISKPKHSITNEERIIAICRTSKTPLFKKKYQFERYNFREFPATVNWQDQITTVDENEEVRMEISFKAKPALDGGKIDLLQDQ